MKNNIITVSKFGKEYNDVDILRTVFYEGFLEVDVETAFLFLKPAKSVIWCKCLILYGSGRFCTCPSRVKLFRKHGI